MGAVVVLRRTAPGRDGHCTSGAQVLVQGKVGGSG